MLEKETASFIENASHELRTPLTIIRGFVETLADFPKLPSQKRKEIIEKVLKTCGRLERVIQGLLRLAELENGPCRSFEHPVDLLALAETAKEELLLLFPKAVVEIRAPLERYEVLADGDLMALALSNLLENSAKYAKDEAPKISLSLSLEEGAVQFEVEDEGIGISEEDLPYIFDRFYAVDKARSRKAGGAGLGLSIVKAIVESHGGEIHAASTLGQGTLFTIRFPARETRF